MATRTRKTQVKDDAHVKAYLAHELSSIDSPITVVTIKSPALGAEVEVVEVPANMTLEEALAESGENLSDLLEEPTKPSRGLSTGRVDKSGVMYAITDKAQKILPIETLQRGCTVAVGAQWRNNEFKAVNTRVAAIEALYEAAEEDTLTHAQAMEALLPLKQAAILGSGTPASYIREFVRVGYLQVI